MTTPVGKSTAQVVLDDEFEVFLKDRTHRLAEKPCATIKEVLKAQADAYIDKTCSPSTSKDISKKSVHSSIDTCVDFSAKKAINAAIDSMRNRASQ